MTEQEVNRILAEFEGSMIVRKYTTDWNDFHRVWMKYVLSDSDTTNLSPILNLITLNPKPSLAAHKLAEIVKQHPSN